MPGLLFAFSHNQPNLSYSYIHVYGWNGGRIIMRATNHIIWHYFKISLELENTSGYIVGEIKSILNKRKRKNIQCSKHIFHKFWCVHCVCVQCVCVCVCIREILSINILEVLILWTWTGIKDLFFNHVYKGQWLRDYALEVDQINFFHQ